MSRFVSPFRSHGLALIVLIMSLFAAKNAFCQDSSFHSGFRLYLDNDCINLRLQFTDEAYTNGLQLGYYRVIDRRPRFPLSRMLPRAGHGSVNTYGWNVMQVMYSPKDLKESFPDPEDYPYSAGLFAVHSLHSSSPEKKFSFRSALTIGVMGPPALGEETQKLVHRIMGFVQPAGWDYQQQTALLANVHFSVEKMLAEADRSFEVVGSASADAGTMFNAVSAHVMLRAGRMNPWFSGLLSQSNGRKGTKKLFISAVASPGIQLMIYNSLVDGGLTRRWAGRNLSKFDRPEINSNIFSLAFNYGFSLAWNRMGISVLQRRTMPVGGRLRDHEVGNVSLTIGF